MIAHYSIAIFTKWSSQHRNFIGEQRYEFPCSYMPADSWLVSILQELARQSVLRRIEVRDLKSFNKVIGACIADSHCFKLLSLPVSTLGRAEATDFLHAADDALKKMIGPGMNQYAWSAATATSSARIMRRWMFGFLDKAKIRQDIGGVLRSFRSEFRTFHRGRQVISDEVDPTYPDELVSPIDALPHQTIVELKELQHRRLNADLQRFVDAAMQELTFWRQARAKLIQLAALPISIAKKQKFVRIFLVAATDRRAYDFHEFSPEEILACIAWYSLQKTYARNADLNSLRTSAVYDAIRSVLGITDLQREKMTVGQIAFMCQRALPRELTSAFIIMLTQTGWNSAALGELVVDHIDNSVPGEYRIDSFKTKNGRIQPDVLIEKDNRAGIQALDFLIWNNKQMRALGLIRADERRLFFSWSGVKEYPLTEQMANMATHLKVFTKLYKLPAISLEQIRNTVLLKATHFDNNLSLAQSIAGHLGVNTTGGYVFHQMMRVKLGKAINLEFQRRLDHSVLYAMRESSPSLSRKENPRYVSKELLFRVGDGTSCTDPTNPPKAGWKMEDGICDGLRCHQGGGCHNNQIVLTKDRLEEVFRLEIYYRENWQRLMDENFDAFESYHGPSMLFNIALADYVRQGLYWTQVEKHLRERGVL